MLSWLWWLVLWELQQSINPISCPRVMENAVCWILYVCVACITQKIYRCRKVAMKSDNTGFSFYLLSAFGTKGAFMIEQGENSIRSSGGNLQVLQVWESPRKTGSIEGGSPQLGSKNGNFKSKPVSLFPTCLHIWYRRSKLGYSSYPLLQPVVRELVSGLGRQVLGSLRQVGEWLQETTWFWGGPPQCVCVSCLCLVSGTKSRSTRSLKQPL